MATKWKQFLMFGLIRRNLARAHPEWPPVECTIVAPTASITRADATVSKMLRKRIVSGTPACLPSIVSRSIQLQNTRAWPALGEKPNASRMHSLSLTLLKASNSSSHFCLFEEEVFSSGFVVF